ncbi:MAG TPA: hypothetical protein PKE06_02065 [Flavilitoribacter sp.]|nr:hypothetical protein [Flavilitoribacter sp.]HMQ88671.1 hypothetical protein [Flavilitoribacter sp.]
MIDLEKYKTAWQLESPPTGRPLTDREIHALMRATSKHILVRFRRGLVFDLIFKAVLLVLAVVLAFRMPFTPGRPAFYLIAAALLIGGMGWQLRTLRRIPRQDPGALSTLDLLLQCIAFYYRYYYRVIPVMAGSGAFFFLIGSLYYLYFKYGDIPPAGWDDLLVLGIGLALSFVLSTVAQVWQGSFHIRQLEERVREMEEHSLSARSLETQRTQMIRNTVLTGIALIIGLLLFLYLIYQQM